MEGLAIGLIMLGFLGSLVSLVVLIVQAVRKKRKKPWALSLVGSIIVLFIGAGLGGVAGEPVKKIEKPSASVKTEKAIKKEKPTIVEERKVAMPKHIILNEDVYDAPIKTQVTLNVLVSGEISEGGLRSLLSQLYSSTKGRKGFKYHDSPTSIYIYVFTSKERAESGMGQWVAMLQKSHDDVKATININERQLAQLGAKPEERFGLPEEKRKEIWKELISIEDRAMKEAEERYPGQLKKQAESQNRLIDEYENKLAEKHGLTREQLGKISLEGVERDWPFPK